MTHAGRWMLAPAVVALAAACGGGSSEPCSGVACSSRGFCLADQGTAYCACMPGYHPVVLECVADDPSNPCLGVDCSGHGDCRVVADGPSCDCATGYRHPDPASPACLEGRCDLLCIPDEFLDGGVDTAADADADADADAEADADVPPECGNGTREGGEECDDGNRTSLDGCENDCTASCHASTECDDFDPCTTDTCAELGGGAAGCSHAIAAGSACDDGDPCTEGEACDASGVCTGGASICACATTTDCAAFEDGDPCNGTLICVGHVCEVDPATVVSCSPAGDTTCRRNVCNPATGSCAYEAINEGAVCDDGAFCTVTDRCAGGACVGAGNPCPTGPCAAGCDEARDSCGFASSSTVCRASVAPCDQEERCTGSSATCPADVHQPDDTICVDDGTLCGAPKNCHVCRSGACVPNTGHWSAGCLPSCGVIQNFCGIPTECCGTGAECAYGEPGGESYDCASCCAYECCLPSQVVEYSCGDYRDNDCDGLVDCDDPDCEFRSCDGGAGFCQFGICVWT